MMWLQLFDRPLTSRRSLWNCFSYAIVSVSLLLASSEISNAQNLVTNGDFGTGDLSGWLIANGRTDQTEISYDGANGLPTGSAFLNRTAPPLEADNRDLLYQFVDVEIGESYTFDAQWKGDLYGDDRSWAEIWVGFVETNDPIPDGDAHDTSFRRYKKASFGGPNDPFDNDPVDGAWDWESVLLSPDGDKPPEDDIYVADNEFMMVSFLLGGRILSTSQSTPNVFYNVDNVSVTLVGGATEPGDYDGTGAVGQGDLDLVLLNWGKTPPPVPAGWVNEIPEGLIGQTQLDGVLLNWGNGTPVALTGVPEPTTLALALLSLCGVAANTRRRS